MFRALRIKLSPQFDVLPENHDPFELEGNQDEPVLIEGNHEDDELEGNQLDEWEELDDGISAAPSRQPTPRPIPNTARTVDSG